MKKTTFFTSVMLLFCFQMQALEFEVDNLMYSTNGSNTVALKGGSSLYKELNIPSVVSHNGIDYSVTALADSVFFRDYNFQSKRLTIPSSITTIGAYAFSYCESLTGILTIPSSVTMIGEGAFSSCRGLTDYIVDPNNSNYSSVNGVLFSKDQTVLLTCLSGKRGKFSISPSVTTIGQHAFYYCRGLTGSLASVTTIGNSAFRNCSGFTDLIIPSSLITIGDYSFASNWKTVVNYQRIPMAIDKSVFDEQRLENCVLKVPTDSKHAYQTANIWKDFGTIEEF